jgi:hypothetical protein
MSNDEVDETAPLLAAQERAGCTFDLYEKHPHIVLM